MVVSDFLFLGGYSTLLRFASDVKAGLPSTQCGAQLRHVTDTQSALCVGAELEQAGSNIITNIIMQHEAAQQLNHFSNYLHDSSESGAQRCSPAPGYCETCLQWNN